MSNSAPTEVPVVEAAAPAVVAPVATAVVKPALTADQREARDKLRGKGERIFAYMDHPISGPALRARLPDLNYDIGHLYAQTEDELDYLQRRIDRTYQNLVGCTVFSSGVTTMAPFIEKALVSIPYIKERGFDMHGFAKALQKNDKIPLVLAHADIEFQQTVGLGAIGGIVQGFLETFKTTNARNIKRRTTLNFAQQTKGKLTATMINAWKEECAEHSLTSVPQLLAHLAGEEMLYNSEDQIAEDRAREATGDYSHRDGADNIPDVSQARRVKVGPNGRPISLSSHRNQEEEEKRLSEEED